jgi:hypothetical protein
LGVSAEVIQAVAFEMCLFQSKPTACRLLCWHGIFEAASDFDLAQHNRK